MTKANFNLGYFLIMILSLSLLSCGDDDPEPQGNAPVASFQFVVDMNDPNTVVFTDFSQNATSYAWDFGDTGVSSEKNPSHTYAGAGNYTVVLTVTNDSGSDDFSSSISIVDPNAALALLTGGSSKTWKLFREGVCMSLGPDAENPAQFWAGLTNDGDRPCLYEQEFTFNSDGSYEFNDNGMFWAEFGVFNGVMDCTVNVIEESCFEAIPANMVNACGDDVSAWLSGTYSFQYNPNTGDLTLNGDGAFIGIPKLGTTGVGLTPSSSVSTKVSIEEFTGYDLMLVEFIYDGEYWPITYVNYSNESLEPDVVTESEEFGEDLDNITPSEMFRSFASNEMGEWALIDSILSGSTVEYGVVDPADNAAKNVGQFNRTDAQFQELQFQTSPEKNDLNFDNFTSVSIEVYLPSSNDHSGKLTKQVIIGLADRSQTEQWWTDLTQYENTGDDLVFDAWNTVSFQLNSPSWVALPDNGATPFERDNIDMIFLNIGGSDHTDVGTFYVRNLIFQ